MNEEKIKETNNPHGNNFIYYLSIIRRAFKLFNKNFNQTEKCSKFCPSECDQYSYEIFHTPHKITGAGKINGFNDLNYVYSLLPQFQTYENVSKAYYLINAYYEDLKYTLISQKPKIELFGLVSNIGGLFSLFLGFSLGSFLELFEVLIELILQKNWSQLLILL